MVGVVLMIVTEVVGVVLMIVTDGGRCCDDDSDRGGRF